MKKFVSFALVLYLLFGCACSRYPRTIINDKDSASYKEYTAYTKYFDIDGIKKSAEENNAEYEFRLLKIAEYANSFYYTVRIYKDKAAEVNVVRFIWSYDKPTNDFEPLIVFEYSGELTAEDTQKFLSVIEETDFFNIPNKNVWLRADSLDAPMICIDGYGNQKRNCITRTAAKVAGEKNEKVEHIFYTLLFIVDEMAGEEYDFYHTAPDPKMFLNKSTPQG